MFKRKTCKDYINTESRHRFEEFNFDYYKNDCIDMEKRNLSSQKLINLTYKKKKQKSLACIKKQNFHHD